MPGATREVPKSSASWTSVPGLPFPIFTARCAAKCRRSPSTRLLSFQNAQADQQIRNVRLHNAPQHLIVYPDVAVNQLVSTSDPVSAITRLFTDRNQPDAQGWSPDRKDPTPRRSSGWHARHKTLFAALPRRPSNTLSMRRA